MNERRDDGVHLLRHALAVLAYRGGKALRGAPEAFATFRVAADSRSAGEILAHLGDLFDWAVSIADGAQRWHDSPVLPWAAGTERYFAALAAFDERLADPRPLGAGVEQLLQGPVADALTHIGQIALLRRLTGAPVRGENYFRAEIVTGRVGPEQAAPRREFD